MAMGRHSRAYSFSGSFWAAPWSTMRYLLVSVTATDIGYRYRRIDRIARVGRAMSTQSRDDQPQLRRRLGVFDAVVIGLGSMIGAGIFAALGPAAAAAGSGLLVGLAVAAVVAYCNATSSARLAARYPQSGGTYVYGRERLGAFWGHLAG